MDTLPICRAKSKQSGQRCKNFAVKNKQVCHIHGGMTPIKHGYYTQKAVEERRKAQHMIRESRQALQNI